MNDPRNERATGFPFPYKLTGQKAPVIQDTY